MAKCFNALMLKSNNQMGGWLDVSGRPYSHNTCGAVNENMWEIEEKHESLARGEGRHVQPCCILALAALSGAAQCISAALVAAGGRGGPRRQLAIFEAKWGLPGLGHHVEGQYKQRNSGGPKVQVAQRDPGSNF